MGEPGLSARLVVVGLGRIGRLHAANLAGRVSGAVLAGVVDVAEQAARVVGERHGVAWSTSLAELLPGADGVVIAAPTALHAELIERAAGVPVFCEKPLGLTVEEARRAAGGVTQVGFQRRFDAGWLALRAAVGRAELTLLRCSHRNAAGPPRGLGDLFVDMAVHDLDCARWLGGEVASVYAQERAGTATISLRFVSGALGLIDLSREASYGFECAAELVGRSCTARLAHAPATSTLREGVASAPLPADHAERHAAAYLAELEHFAAVVRGAAGAAAACDAVAHPASASRAPSGDDAVAALTLALLARRSVATGAPVLVERAVAA